LGHRERDIEQSHFDMLATTKTVAGEKRKQDGVAGRHPRQHVNGRGAGPNRWPVGKAIERHESAFGLRDRVEARTRSEWSFPAIG
jgi:hypothetical protein